MSQPSSDPMDFLKNLWGSTGMPLPGLVTPTLDTDELDKRIADLKAVEGWLKTNLNMLQMSIQGLEMQRATVAAMHAISQSASQQEGASNPFANPALWPWHFMQQQAPDAAAAAEAPPAEAPAKPRRKTKPDE